MGLLWMCGLAACEQFDPAVPVRREGFIGGSPSLGPDLDPLLRDSPFSHQLRHVFCPGEGKLSVLLRRPGSRVRRPGDPHEQALADRQLRRRMDVEQLRSVRDVAPGKPEEDEDGGA